MAVTQVEEPIEASWEILCRARETLPTTMDGLEAIERISLAVVAFLTLQGRLDKSGPITVGILPITSRSKVVYWKAFLNVPSSELETFKALLPQNVEKSSSLEDSLEKLFIGVVGVINQQLEALNREVNSIQEGLEEVQAKRFKLNKLKQAMGSYDRQQLALYGKEDLAEVPRAAVEASRAAELSSLAYECEEDECEEDEDEEDDEFDEDEEDENGDY